MGRWVAKWKSTIDVEQASQTFCAVRAARHNVVCMRAACNSAHRMKNITTVFLPGYFSILRVQQKMLIIGRIYLKLQLKT